MTLLGASLPAGCVAEARRASSSVHTWRVPPFLNVDSSSSGAARGGGKVGTRIDTSAALHGCRKEFSGTRVTRTHVKPAVVVESWQKGRPEGHEERRPMRAPIR